MSTQPAIDTARLSRWIANSAIRLRKLIEMNAPAVIIEKERRILAARIASFPVASKAVSDQVDESERLVA